MEIGELLQTMRTWRNFLTTGFNWSFLVCQRSVRQECHLTDK